MFQLRTLVWLKWTLFRNSLRTSKAVVNRLASVLTMGAAITFAVLMAVGLGFAAYALSSPAFAQRSVEIAARRGGPTPSAEFLFLSIFSMFYILWATLGIGPSRQFDPGNLLLYPISFRKLFAVDLITEVASLQSVLAIPSILGIGVGVGLARGQLLSALLVVLLAAVFGIVLSKWISTSIGSLFRNKRTRGETFLALAGALAALSGVAFAQIAPMIFRHVAGNTVLRWTPPGAIAFALTEGLKPGQALWFILSITVLSAYTVVFIGLTYWLILRSLPGSGPTKRRGRRKAVQETNEGYKGLDLPLGPSELSAVVEKELRYASRNAQLRMMAVMPLILVALRLMNRRLFDPSASADSPFAAELFKYGEGLITSGGILYVFLILTGLSCNLFAFEHAGMRTLVLSPVDRRMILLGKNLAITFVSLILSAALLIINWLVFRDLTWGALLFGGLSFLIYAALISVIGNWLSIRFPKRMKIGTRMNVSGVVGLLLIPMIFLLGLPPLAAVAAGFVAQSLAAVYATLAILAVLSVGLYLLMIGAQGELLQQRELDLLSAVNDPGND